MKEGGGYGGSAGGGGGGGVGVGSAEEALRVGAGKGQTDSVRNLLHAGVDLTPDQEGRTALHYAAHNGHPEVCRLLINQGCPLDLQDSGGYTAVQRACSQGQVESLEACVQMGCSVNLPDQHGNTSLHEAAWHGYSQSLELLLDHNANVFATNKSGFTALHLAAQNGHNESSRVLLYGNVDSDLQNNYGDTALHTAARYGHAGVTRILISAKCQLNLQNKNGDTCLHIAAALKRRKIAKILVESHADIHVLNKQSETAVDVARRKDNPEIVLIINSLARVHSGGVRGREVLGVTFKDEVEPDDGHTGCATEEDPPSKPDKPEKERGFFAFFKKKKKDKDRDNSKDRGGGNRQPAKKTLTTTTPGTQGPTSLPPPSHPAGGPPPAVRRVSGFFSQYVPQSGTQYYRDLAGNIKQGPVGYSPVCHCRPVFQHIEQTMLDAREKLSDHINSSHQVLQERIRQLDYQTSHQSQPLDPGTRKRLEAERRSCQAALDQRLQLERQTAQRMVQTYGQELHSQVQGWLEDHLSSYGHCLDHHHDDSALPPSHIFSDVHYGPNGGRLFRSRSDETLSASDNSGKGRKRQFYESRKAAMEQIRGWKVPAGKKGSSNRRRERGGVSADSVAGDRRDVRDDRGGGSTGRVVTVAADVHHSCEQLTEAAPSRVPASDGREGGGGERWQDGARRQALSGAGGRHSPALEHPRSAHPLPPHIHPGQPPSYPGRPPSRQLLPHGNPASLQSGQWGGASSGQIPPQDAQLQQRMVHGGSTPRDSRVYERSRFSSYHHQRQQQQQQPSRERGGRTQGLGAAGEDSADPVRSGSPSRLYNGERFIQQQPHSALAHPRHNMHDTPDGQRWSARTRSTERLLDGGEGVAGVAGGKWRSRSEERVLDSSQGQQQRSSAADDHSGYVTDSAARSTMLHHSDHNHVSYNHALWNSNGNFSTGNFSTNVPARTDMDSVGGGGGVGNRGQFTRHPRSNVTSPFSQERTQHSASHANNDRGGVGGDPYSGYFQQERTSQRSSSTQQQARPLSYQPPRVQSPVVNSGVRFSAPDTTRPKTPTVRGVTPYPTVSVRTDKLSSDDNAHSSSERTPHPWSDDTPPPPVQHFSTFKPLSDRVQLHDTRRVQPTDASTARVSDRSKQSKEQSATRHNTAPSSSDSTRTYSPRQAQISPDGELPPREAVSSGHYSVSAACLRHKELSYSPVDQGDGKEDSTCSSNQDSGYSSRLMQGKGGRAGVGRGGGADSTTPSSSFSTDLSAGTPSTAGSPHMHLAPNSYPEYTPAGGPQTPGNAFGHTPRDRNEMGAQPQSDWIPPENSTKTSNYRLQPEQQQQQQADSAGRRPTSSEQPSSVSFQRQVQGWYHHKLLEAAQRLRYSQQYGQAGDGERYKSASAATATGVRFDPVHGSDV
ncbi:hypothetical protein ACOMHN_020076 [Nucella lapillus]